MISLRASNCKGKIIQVYAPTSVHTDEDVEAFYEIITKNSFEMCSDYRLLKDKINRQTDKGRKYQEIYNMNTGNKNKKNRTVTATRRI